MNRLFADITSGSYLGIPVFDSQPRIQLPSGSSELFVSSKETLKHYFKIVWK
jgi:hypothetical protein